jgi:pimeloyl-ACP methyl ester carboxylesterase
MSAGLEPFRIAVAEEDLRDLRDRLRRIRWPEREPVDDWSQGVPLAWLQDLCSHWADGYDWRATEARINAFDQVRTRIDGLGVHLLHVRSPHAEALPLVLTHGWPGSVIEFLKVIGPLTDPTAHGGDAADAFHVVCPSIPGYAWSGPTTQPGWDIARVGDATVELMGQLGYDRFGAQGGDWGALIGGQMAVRHPDRLIGLHLNIAIASPPEGDAFEGVSPAELTAMQESVGLQPGETGYSAIQGSKPQTLAYGLNDSPAGLAGWIVEKFRTWSDCDGDVESAFSRDDLLTNITTYWVTGTIGSSVRLYYETMKQGGFGAPSQRVTVPTGVANFPKELAHFPRRWVEACYDLRHWTELPKGGHFAAMEQPELFVGDVRAFFAGLR